VEYIQRYRVRVQECKTQTTIINNTIFNDVFVKTPDILTILIDSNYADFMKHEDYAVFLQETESSEQWIESDLKLHFFLCCINSYDFTVESDNQPLLFRSQKKMRF